MSKRPRSIPVGILVSAGESNRPKRRFRSLDDYPPIKKEVNWPFRIGVVVGPVLAVVVVTSVAWLTARQRWAMAQAPAPALVGQPALQLPRAAPAVAPNREMAVAAPVHHAAATRVMHAEPQPAACSNLGTRVTFHSHPPEAFRQAARENKLVLMVHLSGNFDDQAFT
jgi:hypothetical protein